MEQYLALEDTTDYGTEFQRLIQADGEIGSDICSHIYTIAFLKIKIENLFLIIFASTNKRYKFQIAMIQSLDRFIKFLSVYDMGPSNPIMKKFMEAATTHFLTNLHKVQLEIESNSLEETDEILEAFECIPDTAADGYFRKMQLLLSYNDSFGVTAMLIQQAEISAHGTSGTPKNHTLAPKYDGPPIKIQDSPSSISNNQKRKLERMQNEINNKDRKIKEAEDAIKQLTQANKKNNLPPASKNTITGTTNTVVANANEYCIFFLSTKGCNKSKCQRNHVIPPKKSDAWTKVETLIQKYKFQPTNEFINAK